jgi:hypothetical protein
MCDQLIELASDGAVKITFSEKSLTNFWIHVKSEYPEVANSATKHLLPSPTTYNCEIGFSVLIGLKSVKRNRLNVEPETIFHCTSCSQTGQRLQATPFFTMKWRIKNLFVYLLP